MSTKIYYAARAPAGRVVEFIDFFHDAMEKSAETFIEDMMGAVKDSSLGKPPAHIRRKKGIELWKRAKKWQAVEKLVREGANQGFDVVSCGFNLWFRMGHVYAMPIGGNWALATFDRERFPDWIEDYSYWNNTDEPEHVTQEEWEERKKTWDHICTGNGKASHNARRLYHDVIDAKSGMGMFDFAYPRYQKPLYDWVEEHR